MDFQRRHYEQIASIIARAPIDCRAGIAEDFIRLFQQDNPKFTPGRFRSAAKA